MGAWHVGDVFFFPGQIKAKNQQAVVQVHANNMHSVSSNSSDQRGTASELSKRTLGEN